MAAVKPSTLRQRVDEHGFHAEEAIFRRCPLRRLECYISRVWIAHEQLCSSTAQREQREDGCSEPLAALNIATSATTTANFILYIIHYY